MALTATIRIIWRGQFSKWPDSRGPKMHELRTLILAAGKGTRMKSQKAKVLHHAGGAPLIQHVVSAARPLASEIVVIIGHQAEKVRETIAEAKFVEQTEQLGT